MSWCSQCEGVRKCTRKRNGPCCHYMKMFDRNPLPALAAIAESTEMQKEGSYLYCDILLILHFELLCMNDNGLITL
jgi:hypothetical protein